MPKIVFIPESAPLKTNSQHYIVIVIGFDPLTIFVMFFPIIAGKISRLAKYNELFYLQNIGFRWFHHDFYFKFVTCEMCLVLLFT